MQNWVTIIFAYGKIIIYQITFMIEISFSDAHTGKKQNGVKNIFAHKCNSQQPKEALLTTTII